MSIRSQILLAVNGIAVVAIAAFAWVVMNRVEARANRLAHEAAVNNARFISFVAARGIDQTGVSLNGIIRRLGTMKWLLSFGGEGEATRVQIFSTGGELRFDSARESVALDAGPDVQAAIRGEPLDTPTLAGESLVAASAPLRTEPGGGKIIGAVRVVLPVVGVQEILAAIAPEIVAVGLVVALLALIAALLVGRSISAPISRLTEAARRIAGGDRAFALPQPRGSEVRELTDAYEEMRRELQDKRRIEQLSQDLSHELKNPIASVRALAEALEDGGLDDAQAGPKLVAEIQAASQRLETILADMLTLARLEAQGLDRDGRADLRAVVDEAVAALDVRCRERDVRIGVAGGSWPTLRGDPVWLGRAIGNLLSNAVENTEPGGTVTVSSTQREARQDLSVSNPGEIPAGIRARLFERFVSLRPEGTGLGLAIARSVAEAHGGSLSLAEPGPPDVVLLLSLPRGRSGLGRSSDGGVGQA